MLISRKFGFIFIHIYKNAGSSVTDALMPFVSSNWRRFAIRVFRKLDLHLICPQPFPDHITAPDLRAKLGGSVFDSFFSFAFVRNPWDWQVSLYHFTLKNPDHHQNAQVKEMGDFDTYIRWRCENEVRLQKDFLFDSANRQLVSFVGRFEEIERDFDFVCRRIGVTARLPHINVSNLVHYRKFYSPESASIVGKAFEADIRQFGYEF